MTEAKQRRNQHFQSQVFPAAPPSDTRPVQQHKRSDTYTSNVFLDADQPPAVPFSNQKPTNFARKKYQESSSALDGALEQAMEYQERQESRMEPTSMKRAGIKPNPVRDYDYKPRHNRTQSSTVFTPGDDISPRYNPYRPQDTYDIMGSDSSQFQRKQDPIPYASAGKFEPKYRTVSPHEMKQKEFYGDLRGPSPQTVAPEAQRGVADRRLDWANSSVFPSEQTRTSVTPTRTQRAQTPDNQAYTIFGDPKPVQSSIRSVAPPQLRSSHQMSSSLFDRNFDYSPSKPKEKLIQSNLDWRNADSEVKRKDREMTPGSLAQDQLRSQLLDTADRAYYGMKENGDGERQTQVRTDGKHGFKNLEMASDMHPSDFYQTAYPDSTPVILDFDLSGLGQNMTTSELKRACGAAHIVSVTADMDPLQDRCTGTGRLQVRVTALTQQSLDRMKMNLAGQGITVSPHRENQGRKNNLAGTANVYWNDHRVEIEARKRDEELPPAKFAMMKNLESHGKVFNGSAGTWSEGWKQTVLRETGAGNDRLEREALSSWNQTRGQY